jgi:hypothetical protein
MSDDDWGVLPLANPSDLSDDPRLAGKELRMDDKAYLADQMTHEQHASLTGLAAPMHHGDRQGMLGTQMAATASLPPGTKAQAHDKPMTHEQLMAKAKAMLDAQNVQKEAQLANPALSQRDAAGNMLPAWLTKQGY